MQQLVSFLRLYTNGARNAAVTVEQPSPPTKFDGCVILIKLYPSGYHEMRSKV